MMRLSRVLFACVCVAHYLSCVSWPRVIGDAHFAFVVGGFCEVAHGTPLPRVVCRRTRKLPCHGSCLTMDYFHSHLLVDLGCEPLSLV